MKKLKMWRIFWAPEGKPIAVVWASSATAAKRLTPAPYSKFPGEVYVEEV